MVPKRLLIFVPHYYYPPNFGGAVRVYNIIKYLKRYLSDWKFYIFVLDKGKKKHPFKHTFIISWDPKKEFIRIIPISIRIVRFAKRHKTRLFLVEYTTIPSSIFTILLKLLYPSAIVIVDAHNVEYMSKKKRWKKVLLPFAFLLEYLAVHIADVLITVSELDRRIFRNIFKRKKLSIIIPNGISLDEFDKAKPDEEILKYKPCAVFHGWFFYEFNKKAFDFIIKNIAPELSEINFIIFGKETEYIKKRYFNLPRNVIVLGTVPKERIPKILKACDIAVVPLFWGAGTNLKMVEYLAAGLTIVATPIAARGLNLIPNLDYYIAKSKQDFIKKIKYALKNKIPKSQLIKIAMLYDWEKNLIKLKKVLENLRNL